MAALDLCRRWRAFRTIEDDTQGVAIDADDSKISMRAWRVRNMRGFCNGHYLLEIIQCYRERYRVAARVIAAPPEAATKLAC